jgi:hypothetical protein
VVDPRITCLPENETPDEQQIEKVNPENETPDEQQIEKVNH